MYMQHNPYQNLAFQQKRQYTQIQNRAVFLSPNVQAKIEREAKLSDFKILQVLGEGSFGQVHKVQNKMNKKLYAIKKIGKKMQNPKALQMIVMEIKIMYKLNHENIVKLYNHFEDSQFVYLIMELTEGGEVYDKLCKSYKSKFTEKIAKRYIRHLCHGLAYLHGLNPQIIHRDIKAENLLLDKNDVVKIADFGWSNFLKQDSTRQTQCGTLLYLAPEMVEKKPHDHRVDIWAIGILIYEFLTGNPPFYPVMKPGKTGMQLEQETRGLIARGRINFPNDFPPLAKSLVQKILKHNPKDRLTIPQILNHAWLLDGQPKKIVQQQCVYNQSIKNKLVDAGDLAKGEHLGFNQQELTNMHFRPESIMTLPFMQNPNQQQGKQQKNKYSYSPQKNQYQPLNLQKNNTSPQRYQQQKKVIKVQKIEPKVIQPQVNSSQLNNAVNQQKGQITSLKAEVKQVTSELNAVWEKFKEQKKDMQKQQVKIKELESEKQELYLKKKKYKTQSQNSVGQINQQLEVIELFRKYTDQLRSQVIGLGAQPVKAQSIKDQKDVVKDLRNSQEVNFLQEQCNNYKNRMEFYQKQLSDEKNKSKFEMTNLRESQKVFSQSDNELKEECLRLKKRLQQEQMLLKIKDEKIQELQSGKTINF